jgi:hypothetical protein
MLSSAITTAVAPVATPAAFLIAIVFQAASNKHTSTTSAKIKLTSAHVSMYDHRRGVITSTLQTFFSHIQCSPHPSRLSAFLMKPNRMNIYPQNCRIVAIGIKSELTNPVWCQDVDPATQDDIAPNAHVVVFRSLPRAMHPRRYYCMLVSTIVDVINAHDATWGEDYTREFNDPHPPEGFTPVHHPLGRPYRLPTAEVGTPKYFNLRMASRITAWAPSAPKNGKRKIDVVEVD